jgi:HEAT repeat protein
MATSPVLLLELLDDPHPSVRRNAVVALTATGGASAIRGLARVLARDPSVMVRREAIDGLRSAVNERPATAGGRPNA